jgi:hypothetical protein
LYRGIAAIDLTAGPGYAGPVFLAQVSHNETLLPETEALAKAYLDRGAPVEVRALTAPPLWARIDRVDCPELAEATLQWLESVCGGGHG